VKLESHTANGKTVEFWKCENPGCGKVRRITPDNVPKMFAVEPDYCSARCKRQHQQKRDYVPAGQMSLVFPEA
jgi:hypothetical protein